MDILKIDYLFNIKAILQCLIKLIILKRMCLN